MRFLVIASVVLIPAGSQLLAQSDTSRTTTSQPWVAATVTPGGRILGAGVEVGRLRVGPELFASGPFIDGQLHERLTMLSVAYAVTGGGRLYVKAGLGHARRWTEGGGRSESTTSHVGFGLLLPPRKTVALRLSVDGTHSIGESEWGQYPYSLYVGVGLLLRKAS